jgi:hypothetical protein
MSLFPIYSYGSGYLEWYLLSAVSSLVYSPQFAMAAKIGALLAFAMAFMQTFSKRMADAHIRIPSAFVTIALVYMVFIVPNVSVSIIDHVNPNVPNGGIVNRVPIGVAVPVSLASQLGNTLADVIGHAFSLPNTLSYTSSGLGLSLTMPSAAYSASINDPILLSNYNQFFGNCVEPGILRGYLSDQQIELAGDATDNTAPNYSGLTSVGLWQYYGTYATGAGANLLTTYYDENQNPVTQSTITCSQAYSDITNDMENYVNGSLEPALAAASGLTAAQYDQKFGLVNADILNIAQSASNQLMQTLAVNTVSEAVAANAQAAGANVNNLAYGTSIAEQQQKSTFAMIGLTVAQFLPSMYGVLQGLVSVGGVFLLMFLMFPFGHSYAKMYSQLLLWMVLWAPFATVINYMQEVIMQLEGVNQVSGYGYSLASMGIMHNNYLSSMFGWSGMLMSSLPLITYYFATGSSYGLAMFAGSLDSSLGSGVSGASRTMATGAIKQDAVNMDNWNSNQMISSRRDTAGTPLAGHYGLSGNLTKQSLFGGGYSYTDEKTGASAAQNASGIVDAASGGNTGINGIATHSMDSVMGEKLTNAKSDEAVAAKNVISGATSMLMAENGVSSGNKGSQSNTLQGTAARKIANSIAQTAKEMGISKQEAMHEWMTEEGLKFNIKPLRGVGKLMGNRMPFAVAADLGVSAKQVSSSSLSNIREKAFNDDLAKNLSTELSHTKGLKAEQWGGASSALKNSYSAFSTANDSFLKSRKDVNSIEHDMQVLKKDGISVTDNELTAYANFRGWNAKQTVEGIDRMAVNKGSLDRFLKFADNNGNITAAINKINSRGQEIKGPGSASQNLKHLNNLNRKNDLWVNGRNESVNGMSYQSVSGVINEALKNKKSIWESGHQEVRYADQISEAKHILAENPNLKKTDTGEYNALQNYIKVKEGELHNQENLVKKENVHNTNINHAVDTVTPKPPTNSSLNGKTEKDNYNNHNGFLKTSPNVATGAQYAPNNYTLPPGFNW